MAAADAHSVTRKRRQIDVGHSSGCRVTPSENDFLFCFEQQRFRTCDLKLQHATFGEHFGGGIRYEMGEREFGGSATRRGLASEVFRADRGIPDQARAALLTENNARAIPVCAIRTNLHPSPLYQPRYLRLH